ncbi:MAG: endo-1,4-beta-xylanase [Spirochaetia bacterium]|nr:endo-1,4-beta-xylanase [Spirochaetia bacterium]
MKKKSIFINFFMKVTIILLLFSFAFVSCKVEPDSNSNTNSTVIEAEDKIIDSPETGWYFTAYSLKDYANKTVTIDFSCDIKVVNDTGSEITLLWQINQEGYPIIAEKKFAAGTTDFTEFKTTDNLNGSNKNILLGEDKVLYLSNYGIEDSKVKIEIKNVKYKVTLLNTNSSYEANWLNDSVPSLYEKYKDYFEYVGLACEYDSWNGVRELVKDDVCEGLKKHGNTITMGNEFKPDGFFGYMWSGSGITMVDFKASNGLTIKVPDTLNFDIIDKCLSQCKKHGLQMRGHVLVWHSQTPDNFFAKNYVAQTSGEIITNLVSKEEMSARQEWYIKTVLEHVSKWEKENNDGKHIIWAWDVVNEAVADDASGSTWARGSTANTKDKQPGNSGSRWYQVYGSEEFIVDAFRYANAYAPSDVKLCYNDYNEYMGNKTEGICKLIDAVLNGEEKTVNGKSVKPRIDAMGMQSHISVTWPGVQGYENAIKTYLKKGIDIHVTEFDINEGGESNSADCYGEYFKMIKKYGKTCSEYGGNHIKCVTLWGINNSTSWIYQKTKYPLIFNNFKTTKAFWKVIEAAK